jgi:hypothetical protein
MPYIFMSIKISATLNVATNDKNNLFKYAARRSGQSGDSFASLQANIKIDRQAGESASGEGGGGLYIFCSSD